MQTFELRSLLDQPRLVGPVLGYVFPEIERQMRTDAPMFLLLDDAAVTWLTPQQGAQETNSTSARSWRSAAATGS